MTSTRRSLRPLADRQYGAPAAGDPLVAGREVRQTGEGIAAQGAGGNVVEEGHR